MSLRRILLLTSTLLVIGCASPSPPPEQTRPLPPKKEVSLHEEADKHFRRGEALGIHDDFEGAIHEYSLTLQIDPEHKQARLYRSFLRSRTGNFLGALQDANMACKQSPEKYRGHLARGNANYGLGRYKSALRDYDEALARNPSNGVILANRGLCLMDVGQYDRAINDLREAAGLISSKRRLLTIYRHLMTAYNYVGDKESVDAYHQACEDLKRELSRRHQEVSEGQ